MPDTGAPWNIPYVEATDLVRDWPTDSEALAEAIADGLDAAGNAGIGSNVVSVSTASVTTTTSTSFIDVVDLVASITPTSATSRILVLAQVVVSMNDAESAASRLRVLRDSTSLGEFAAFSTDASSNSMQGFGFGTSFVDSPATTSEITYKVQVRSGRSIRTVRVNRTGNNSGGATSVITLIEVAA